MASFDIFGIFEYHITVKLESKEDIFNLEAFCVDNGLKLTIIELPSGAHPNQVMIGNYITGGYNAVLQEVYGKFLKALHNNAFTAIRIKIESITSNIGVPEDTTDKLSKSPLFDKCYFEFHWKIELNPEDPLKSYNQLRDVANDHGKLYLSRNVYKRMSKNCHHVFLTLRNMDGGKKEALEDFHSASDFIESHGFKIVKSEREFVVHDSNIKLDDEWKN